MTIKNTAPGLKTSTKVNSSSMPRVTHPATPPGKSISLPASTPSNSAGASS
ncbi:MAG: hypothetical protein H7A51_03025 [Akkermansiaceae bacterium]|nr:hypothetical protein [Akkermansiaceae bacterium]